MLGKNFVENRAVEFAVAVLVEAQLDQILHFERLTGHGMAMKFLKVRNNVDDVEHAAIWCTDLGNHSNSMPFQRTGNKEYKEEENWKLLRVGGAHWVVERGEGD